MASEKSSTVTVKTSTEKDFQTALNNIGKFLKINPDMYSEFEIFHQGNETLQQLTRCCLIDPTEEEKKSTEFMEIARWARSFGIEICNVGPYDKTDLVDATDAKNHESMKKKKICEGNNCNGVQEINNIEVFFDPSLKMGPSNTKEVFEDASKPVMEMPAADLKCESEKNRLGNNEDLNTSLPDVKQFTSLEILDLMICDAGLILPEEGICNAGLPESATEAYKDSINQLLKQNNENPMTISPQCSSPMLNGNFGLNSQKYFGM